jgi:hypothetical protein
MVLYVQSRRFMWQQVIENMLSLLRPLSCRKRTTWKLLETYVDGFCLMATTNAPGARHVKLCMELHHKLHIVSVRKMCCMLTSEEL